VLKTGIARSEVIDRLGDPDETIPGNGAETDTYTLRSIPDPSSSSRHKWEMVDLELLLLPEIVMTPAALYGDYVADTSSRKCRVVYGTDERITHVDCQVAP
jgi:hypothetical protein